MLPSLNRKRNSTNPLPNKRRILRKLNGSFDNLFFRFQRATSRRYYSRFAAEQIVRLLKAMETRYKQLTSESKASSKEEAEQEVVAPAHSSSHGAPVRKKRKKASIRARNRTDTTHTPPPMQFLDNIQVIGSDPKFQRATSRRYYSRFAAEQIVRLLKAMETRYKQLTSESKASSKEEAEQEVVAPAHSSSHGAPVRKKRKKASIRARNRTDTTHTPPPMQFLDNIQVIRSKVEVL
ncbi:hypothetical protein FQA39_LY01130 [Lamprigera yunnana]|nr:hypothetical protein FQA39_LY01130 [Lamprigera yunnana]